MRILINALSARQGGGQTYLRNLLIHLPRPSDIEVFMLAPDSLRTAFGQFGPDFLPVPRFVANPLARAAWERVMLPRLADSVRADILFCPGGITGGRPRPPCRTATMFRNMIPFDPEQRKRYPFGYARARNWLLRRVMMRSMCSADLVIFVSEYARKVVEQVVGHHFARAVVIPHGIPEAFRAQSDQVRWRPISIPPGRYLLYVSTLDFYKAQIEVVRGYHLMRLRRNCAEKLLLVGPENPAYGKLVRDEIARLGLSNYVLLLGKRSYAELPTLYLNAEVIIFASECENCPNILLESLAAARPILCSDRPPMPEFGGDGVMYFNPASPEDLAEKMISIIDDKHERARLSARAAARAQHYDWAISSQATWDALRTLAHH